MPRLCCDVICVGRGVLPVACAFVLPAGNRMFLFISIEQLEMPKYACVVAVDLVELQEHRYDSCEPLAGRCFMVTPSDMQVPTLASPQRYPPVQVMLRFETTGNHW